MHHTMLIGFLGSFFLAFQLAAKPMQGEVVITTSERPWVTEAEFAQDASLHATELQTIVLDLESSTSGKRSMQGNLTRFVVSEERHYQFCIPVDEPHIRWVKLKRTHGRTLLNTRRGDRCDPTLLSPGSYELRVFHHARSMPVDGKKAFMYHPKGQTTGLSSNRNLPNFNFAAFQSSNNGLFASNATAAPAVRWAAITDAVGANEIWRIIPVDAVKKSKFSLKNGLGEGLKICRDGGNSIYTGEATNVNCGGGDNGLKATFKLTGVGSFQYNLNLAVAEDGAVLGGAVHTGSNNYLLWGGSANTVYTTPYHGYDCSTVCDDTTLPLAAGQIALYTQCDFQGSAFVFTADMSDLAIFDGAAAIGLGAGNNMTRSIRVGPDTVARLYPEAQNSGTVLTAGANIPCLDSTSLGNDALSSFQIIDQSPLQYIIASKGCQNCILTGIDFDKVDFSGLDFTGSVFTAANLNSTSFQVAKLTQTHFSGVETELTDTDFSGATLTCASFSAANVSSAQFHDIVLADDFSCYLDMESTSIDFALFPTEYWRHTDLTGSTMNNLPHPLSTTTAPLDLSGVILDQVTWLQGLRLDSINLGCYPSEPNQITVCPTPSGDSHCSTLQGTVLTSASLKNACLQEASMEGIFLSFSNLDGADLSGAQLEALTGGKVATLEGAFMRNVKLFGANLTGVNASDISFYTVAGGTADATNITAPGANFSGAYLAFADFSGSTANLQSTIWTNAMLLGANFTQADLTTNTSGGVNSGTNTTFSGAYLQGTIFTEALLEDVDFTNTYWDALGIGGELNFLIPKGNLQFKGYWKDISLPECPPSVTYMSGNLPPMNVTDATNTCPNANPGPCDAVWDQPKLDISLAYYSSALPPAFPQDANVTADLQCSNSFSDPNPEDFCWITTNNPTLCSEN